MKLIISLLVIALCTPFLSTAQQGRCKWRVTFTYNETKTSSRQSPVIDSKYSFKMNGSVTMLIDGELPFDKGHVILTTPQDKVLSFSTTGSVHSQSTEITKDPVIGILETRTDDYSGNPDQSEQGLEFEYDPEGAKYINAGIRFNKKGHYVFKQVTVAPGEKPRNSDNPVSEDFGTYTASIGSSGDVIKEIKNGFTIDGHLNEVENKPATNDETYTSNHSVEYHVTITRESDLIAIIEPIGGFDNYLKWLPEGPDPNNEKHTGNSIKFRVYLQDKKKPGQKITDGIASVKYYFDDDVSHEPGYAMNFPVIDPDKKADLQLGKIDDRPDMAKEITEITITGKEEPGLEVKVESFDYGGYGKLKATVTLSTGEVVQAIDLSSKKMFMPIPYRLNDESQVSDNWKEINKALKLQDDDDNEEAQNGVGDEHNGDGFSLYEEYRGFIENKKHIRTSPVKKDLMVCSLIKNDRWQSGIFIFESVTGMAVHYKFKEDEFGEPVYNNDRFANDRVMNFNFSKKDLHVVNQHGIVFVIDNSVSYCEAVNYSDDPNKMGTPKDFKYLRVGSGFSPKPSGYNVVRADINDDGTFTVNPNGKGVIYTDEYASTIAHEKLHCCNVWHHGDRDLGSVTWEKHADGSVMELKYDEGGKIIAKRKITVLNENGTPCTNWMDANDSRNVIVGVKHGQCSGVEDCIMRYDNTDAYAESATDPNRYFIQRGAQTTGTTANGQHNYAELTGITLCTQAAGTGVNAEKRDPRSRYGDADQKAEWGKTTRGNCKKQVCINDKFH